MYLKLFYKSKENQVYLLNIHKARDLRQDDNILDAILATWQISFKQIQKTRPEAADLLSLITMFDKQGIPKHLLYNSRNRLQFKDAVALLISFSLIRTQTGKQSEQPPREQLFKMHSLVQLAIRKWLELHSQVDKWQQVSLQVIAATFLSRQHKTQAACQALLPHLRKLLNYDSKGKEATLDQAIITVNTIQYLVLIGEYTAVGNIN